MGVGEGDAVRSGPSETAIGGSEHPGAEERLALGRGGGALGSLPAGKAGRIPLFSGFGFGQEWLVGERGEGIDEQGAGGGFAEAGVAVVDGGIEDDLGPGPGTAVVEGAGEFDAAEGADVVFAAAGVGSEELAGTAPDQRGPRVVEAGLVGDRLYRDAFEAGGGEKEELTACEHGLASLGHPFMIPGSMLPRMIMLS